ncbi:MAG: hypothetical protein B6244_02210 [Candidatus Cloacimonetes bacterium 4572_55]|nr:MAG: hypothetical protein B6244_02210 [Candidatus Cloacimonetes bacterium 4572_55]
MAEYNNATKEINVKIVYYGPGLCGKTTNLQYIHSNVNKENRGEMIALATKTDRTLYFDFLPIHAGTIQGFKTRFLLYTVPGQVYYDSTRKVVLRGADGVIFVADSSPDRMEANSESLRNLDTNLREHKMNLKTIPWVMQLNKRDLANALPVEQIMEEINTYNVPAFRGCAVTGEGVFEILHRLIGMTMKHLNQKAIDARRGAIFNRGSRKKKGETPDFENMNWFSDLSNPPKLNLETEVKLGDKPKTKKIKEEPPTSESLSIDLPEIDVPSSITIDLPEIDQDIGNLSLPVPEKPKPISIPAPPPISKGRDKRSDKVLRVRKAIDLPLQIREIPRQIQLNLTLNIKLIPYKQKKLK